MNQPHIFKNISGLWSVVTPFGDIVGGFYGMDEALRYAQSLWEDK